MYFSDAPVVLFPGHSDEHSPGCVSRVCRTSPYGKYRCPGLKILTMFVKQPLWGPSTYVSITWAALNPRTEGDPVISLLQMRAWVQTGEVTHSRSQ